MLYIIISLLNIIFPRVLIPIMFMLYLGGRKKLKYNLIFSFALLGYSYKRLDGTGDISKYMSSFYNYFQNTTELFSSLESKIYYTWTIINTMVIKLNLNFEYVTLISMSIFFYFIFSIFDLIDLENKKKIKGKIVIKFFMTISLVTLFSSYKNIISFAIISYCLYQYILNRKINIFYGLLGMGFHASGIVLIVIYLISRIKKINNKIIFLSLITLIFNSYIIEIVHVILSKVSSLYSTKLMYYTLGKWGKYDFGNHSELITYYLMIIILINILYSIFRNKKIKEKEIEEYWNFMRWYLIFIILILPYRTLAIRYIISAFPIFLLLFYKNLSESKNKVTVIFWFFLFDIRFFTNIFNSGYQIGDGFVKEIFNNIYSIFF